MIPCQWIPSNSISRAGPRVHTHPGQTSPETTRRHECVPCGVATHCTWLAKQEAKGTPSEVQHALRLNPAWLRDVASSNSAQQRGAGSARPVHQPDRPSAGSSEGPDSQSRRLIS